MKRKSLQQLMCSWTESRLGDNNRMNIESGAKQLNYVLLRGMTMHVQCSKRPLYVISQKGINLRRAAQLQ